MTLISDNMKYLNEELHGRMQKYGTSAYKNLDKIIPPFIEKYNIDEILDYGCGKGTLRAALVKMFQPIKVTNYDPCMPEFSARPTGTFQSVLCNDVLEHVEPEFLDNVLEDIYNYGEDYFYFAIGLTESTKKLANGQQNHLIVENSEWWKMKLVASGFKILETLEDESNPSHSTQRLYIVICEREEGTYDGH